MRWLYEGIWVTDLSPFTRSFFFNGESYFTRDVKGSEEVRFLNFFFFFSGVISLVRKKEAKTGIGWKICGIEI